jgi:hypothetical protein
MNEKLHQNHELSSRLAGYVAAAGAIVALVPNVSGQVQYSGIQDIDIDNPGGFALDMNSDATTDFLFVADGYSITGTSVSYKFLYGVILSPVAGTYANSWLISNTGFFSVVAGLEDASVINSGMGPWGYLLVPFWYGALGVYYSYMGSTYKYGNFLDQERYIGVRFHIGTNLHYGWIRASMTSDAQHLILHDWAYETTPGTGITAEDIWKPIPTLTPGVPVRTNIKDANVAVTFDEPITGLTLGDFTVSNGTATGLITVTPGLAYTLQVSANVHGSVVVTLPADMVTDASSNGNVEASANWFYDNIIPTVALNPGNPIATNVALQTVDIIFSEDVLDVELADFIVTNGTKGSLTTVVPNREYSLPVTASAEGMVTLTLPAGSVIDYGNNPIAETSVSWMYDVTPPVVTLTPDQTGLTNQQLVTVTILFDEEIEGLDISDLVVTNGVASNLVEITPGEEYTVDITASADGDVTVQLPADAVTDLAGNGNGIESASWTYDGTIPDVTLDAGVTLTNEALVEVSIEFSEEVQGLELTDIEVTNGVASNLVEVTPGLEYTVDITASGDGNVNVDLPAGAVTDLAGNENVLASVSWIYDGSIPEITFDSGIPGATNQQMIVLGIQFSEEVSVMELTDIVVTNGSAANLVEVTPNLEYTVEITATAEGEVNVEIPADAVIDLAGNGNDMSSISWAYDLTSPNVTLNHGLSGPTNSETIAVTVQFNEEIEGLDISDFNVTNGTAANLMEVTSGTVFTVEITAGSDGTVTLDLPAASVTDLAGNDNTAGSTSWEFDGTSPTVVLDAGVTGTTTDQTVTVSVTFSESIEGFTAGDFNVTNGSAANLVIVTAGTDYTIDITADAGGDVTVTLPAGSVTDEAGNPNESASVTYNYDSGSALNELSDALINLYPNPATDFITVELNREATITFTYITGEIALVRENVLNEVIDLSGLPKGMYLMRIATNESISIHKIVIE